MLDLIFTSTGNTSIKLRAVGSPHYYQISANNEPYTVGESIPLSNNEQVEFKTHPTVFYFSESPNDYFNFVVEGEGTVTVSGNINRTPTDYCYYSLFSGCNKLTDASQLQIHQGGDYPNKDAKMFCFSNMFKDCTALTTPPSSLAASGLADWCYQGMFAGCSKMTSAPQLPATTLAPYCYYAMFYGCSSLTSAPHLSASTLVDWCYNSMFFNCQSLTSISADFTDWNTSGNSTKNWVTGIETIGDFYNQNVEIEYGVDGVPQNWKPDYSAMPLTFKSTGNTTVYTGNEDLYYNKNKTGWSKYNANDVIQLSNGDKVSFSGTASAIMPEGQNTLTGFATDGTGTLEVLGNPHSVINWGELSAGCFAGMFASVCKNIVNASNLTLTATTLAEGCYSNMFYNCTSLTAAPQLPATTLATRCYYYMFNHCTSLIVAPSVLPATTVKPYSYADMFQNCYSLVNPPKLSAIVFQDYISDVLGCCWGMFRNCTALNNIEVCFTSWPTGRNSMSIPLDQWTTGVASNGTFTKPAALSTIFNTDGGRNAWIPSGWTVINK